MIWVWILWGVFASRIYSGSFFFFYYLFIFPAPILLFGFLFKSLWEKKIFKVVSLLFFSYIIFFHVNNTAVFNVIWRDIKDLKKTAEIIAVNVDEEQFNIATIQKDADRWDRNAVDYRYFVETFNKKRALDWYPEDYENAKILFVVDEEGKADVLKSPIMEIQKFNPDKIIGKWSVGTGAVVYKLSKKTN